MVFEVQRVQNDTAMDLRSGDHEGQDFTADSVACSCFRGYRVVKFGFHDLEIPFSDTNIPSDLLFSGLLSITLRFIIFQLGKPSLSRDRFIAI